VVATEAGRKGDDSLEGVEATEATKGELAACERFKTCVDIRRYVAVWPWHKAALRATFVGALGESTCRLNELMLLCVNCGRQKTERVTEDLAARCRWGNVRASSKKTAKHRHRLPLRQIQRILGRDCRFERCIQLLPAQSIPSLSPITHST
jgi:hypothetical protein